MFIYLSVRVCVVIAMPCLCVAMSCEQVKKKAFFVDLPQETVSEKALEAAGEYL